MSKVARRTAFVWSNTKTETAAFWLPAGATNVSVELPADAGENITVQRYVAGVKSVAAALLAPGTTDNWDTIDELDATDSKVIASGSDRTAYFGEVAPGYYRLQGSDPGEDKTYYVVYDADFAATDALPVVS